MSFFEPPEPVEPPEHQPQPVWSGPPESALGAAATVEPVTLVSTDGLVIGVTDLVVYPEGLELDVVVLRRRAAGRPKVPMAMHDLHMHVGQQPDALLRFGIQFADGRKATNVGVSIPPGGRGGTLRVGVRVGGDEPPFPVLFPRGGGGNGLRYTQRFWLWPLPPPGSLVFACEWPAEDVGLSRAEIDAGPILEAAGLARVFWAPSAARPS